MIGRVNFFIELFRKEEVILKKVCASLLSVRNLKRRMPGSFLHVLQLSVLRSSDNCRSIISSIRSSRVGKIDELRRCGLTSSLFSDIEPNRMLSIVFIYIRGYSSSFQTLFSSVLEFRIERIKRKIKEHR